MYKCQFKAFVSIWNTHIYITFLSISALNLGDCRKGIADRSTNWQNSKKFSKSEI